MFSPYSGRVSRLIARPGDYVERGAPLFAIEASEFVHGQRYTPRAIAYTNIGRIPSLPCSRESVLGECIGLLAAPRIGDPKENYSCLRERLPAMAR